MSAYFPDPSIERGRASRLPRRSLGRPQDSVFSFAPTPIWIRQKGVLHLLDTGHYD